MSPALRSLPFSEFGRFGITTHVDAFFRQEIDNLHETLHRIVPKSDALEKQKGEYRKGGLLFSFFTMKFFSGYDYL